LETARSTDETPLRDRFKTMTLATDEFIRRFLIHVLPGGFHRIRHYGLFASGSRIDNIARAGELHAVPPRPYKPDEDAATGRQRVAHARQPMSVLRRPQIITETDAAAHRAIGRPHRQRLQYGRGRTPAHRRTRACYHPQFGRT